MLNLAELGVLGFACYRGTQLIVHDTILDPLRDQVIDWRVKKPESNVRDLLLTLISCVYCTGWWVAGFLLATYLLASGQWAQAPVLVHGIEWLAVAGAGVVINRWDDTRNDQ
ncbi:DUF1360 domain-containing protein [Streptomyces sp. NRRL S-350]|uniref:DUF1360 domain-containing protein n=1 Tax=Streptomyces sp. NRRL S-350 TaxID=1463902 RepID=UPI0004BFB856|nr:DUF1360 domain-containing protein [Streptomyces sp. NRRL S-350]